MSGAPSRDGTLQAVSDSVLLGVKGQGEIGVQLGGLWVGSVDFEVSLDGQVYIPLMLTSLLEGISQQTVTTPGIWVGPVAGISLVRVRCSGFTSGLIVVTMQAAQSGMGLPVQALRVDVNGNLLTVTAESLVTVMDYDVANNPIYLGRAALTSATSAAVWQIRKLTYDGANNPTSIRFANGSLGFAAIWDNRAALAYS